MMKFTSSHLFRNKQRQNPKQQTAKKGREEGGGLTAWTLMAARSDTGSTAITVPSICCSL